MAATELLPGDCFLVLTDSDQKKLSWVNSVGCQSPLRCVFFFLSEQNGCRCLFSFALFKMKTDNFSIPTPAFQRVVFLGLTVAETTG